jgi:hypothetical protein
MNVWILYDLEKLEMEEAYVDPKNKRQRAGITKNHHSQLDCFNDVLDWLVQELDGRFNERTSNLLIGPHLLVQKTHSKILIRRVG